ncbi:hypothetical protein N9L43_00890 [bacterium]|nr:hypothetical protein [bacterium]MDB2656772.1 hypothetical protein [Crocinitomicaceae bacterium]
MPNPIFTPGSPERKLFLKELNAMAKYTGDILHGDELTPVRERQLRKYFHKTYKMLHRIVEQQELNNNSFKYGYGGKLLVRKVLLQFGVIVKTDSADRKATYQLQMPIDEIDLELVSRIIVEVYLIRNDISEY